MGAALKVFRASGLKGLLESRVEFDTNCGCWLWTGALRCSRKMRPAVTYPGHPTETAYRTAYETYKGPIPAGLFVCHSCDVPLCINPDHLFLGTTADNMADMVKKGRASRQRGSANPQAKLTEEQVVALRASNEPNATLAERYGVTSRRVAIIRGDSEWRGWRAA